MGTHDGHRNRMKQEFLQGGLSAFSEVRALELLLFYSRLQGDVNPTAHALLDTSAPWPVSWMQSRSSCSPFPVWGKTPPSC